MVTITLEEVAEAAEETAREQRQVARTARAVDRELQQGMSWSAILNHRSGTLLVQLLARSGRRILVATSTLRRVIIGALADDGLSTRQIAKLLGVTHQRVSAMRDRGD